MDDETAKLQDDLRETAGVLNMCAHALRIDECRPGEKLEDFVARVREAVTSRTTTTTSFTVTMWQAVGGLLMSHSNAALLLDEYSQEVREFCRAETLKAKAKLTADDLRSLGANPDDDSSIVRALYIRIIGDVFLPADQLRLRREVAADVDALRHKSISEVAAIGAKPHARQDAPGREEPAAD